MLPAALGNFAVGIFSVGIFAVRIFRRTGFSLSGIFAVRNFRRKEFSPYGVFAVRNIRPMNIWFIDYHSIISISTFVKTKNLFKNKRKQG